MQNQASNASPGRAIVIGGSLSGLFSAVMLRTVGWAVQVFERSPGQLDSRGGGLVLQQEVVQLLEAAGINPPDTLEAVVSERVYLDGDGNIAQRVPMTQAMTAWSALYDTLRRALPDGVYHQGKTLLQCEQDGHGVTAFFADGHSEWGDLLVAADGGGSTVRHQLLEDIEPRYAGYVAYRGLVDEERLSAEARALFRERFVFYQYAGSHILQYPIPSDGVSAAGQRRHNWVWYVNTTMGNELVEVLTDDDGVRHGRSIPPGRISPVVRSGIYELAQKQLNPPFHALVAATEAPFVQPILDLCLPRMVFDRIVLIGESACIPRPHTAASTLFGAVGAYNLSRCLGSHGHQVPGALAAWEPELVRLGERLQHQGQALGNRSQFPEMVGS